MRTLRFWLTVSSWFFVRMCGLVFSSIFVIILASGEAELETSVFSNDISYTFIMLWMIVFTCFKGCAMHCSARFSGVACTWTPGCSCLERQSRPMCLEHTHPLVPTLRVCTLFTPGSRRWLCVLKNLENRVLRRSHCIGSGAVSLLIERHLLWVLSPWKQELLPDSQFEKIIVRCVTQPGTCCTKFAEVGSVLCSIFWYQRDTEVVVSVTVIYEMLSMMHTGFYG